MTARRIAAPRTALLLLAVASLVGGLWLVVGNRAVQPGADWARRLPGWWPLPRAEAGAAGTYDWWAPSVMGALAAVLLAVLGLSVRLVVRGARRRSRLALAGPRLWLSPDALTAAMTDEVEGVSGVRRARVGLGRAGRAPYVRITVFLEQRSDPRAVLRALEDGPLDRARAALAPTPLHADIRFRARQHRTRRTR
ncbi:hypothetical protein ACH4SP_09785 [Streptomyces sp. NPDC021093]|uniref:hypothetical protein n=1 Tax=Streptomyces sp. NPDC021093 TaxID=3365112 RepID=UPI00378C06C7